jgi:hypothetical protein
MIKVSQYEQHAAECRQMAARVGDPDQKAQLEEMAQAWEALARDRAEQLLRKGIITRTAEAFGEGADAKPH